MKTKILILATVLVFSLVVFGLAFANGGIELPRWVLGGGGADTTAGDVTVRVTIGQPVVGVISSGEVTLEQGFWQVGGGIYNIFMPLIQR